MLPGSEREKANIDRKKKKEEEAVGGSEKKQKKGSSEERRHSTHLFHLYLPPSSLKTKTQDCKSPDVKLTNDADSKHGHLSFRGKGEGADPEAHEYGLDLNLFAAIDVEGSKVATTTLAARRRTTTTRAAREREEMLLRAPTSPPLLLLLARATLLPWRPRRRPPSLKSRKSVKEKERKQRREREREKRERKGKQIQKKRKGSVVIEKSQIEPQNSAPFYIYTFKRNKGEKRRSKRKFF